MKRRERERLDIEAMAPSGEGRAGGVFVAGALPGEQVMVAREGKRAVVVEVARAHPERVTPRCPVAGRCGGCDWMHASGELQARMHLEVVAGLLARHRIEAPLTIESVGAPFGYRDRVRLSLRVRGRAEVGYRAARSKKLVVVDACPVLEPSIERAIGDLATALRGSSGEGDARVARGAGDRPVVELSFRGDLAGGVFGAFADLCGEAWAGARIWPEGASEPASYGDPRPVVTAADGAPLWLAPGGFGQPSEAAGVALGRHVAARSDGASSVVELFAGSGTLTVAAAPGKSYVAVEESAAAVAALRENLSARSLSAKCVVGDANAHRIGAAELVILDPPRIGAAGAVQQILAARPKRVVYVSCNPVTLARDLGALGERYRVEEVTLFDVFPQTSHVEAVATLTRA